MNREICCRQNQTPFFSTVPSNIKKIHSGQTSSNEKQELSPFNHGASPVYSGILMGDNISDYQKKIVLLTKQL
jgi:hypothetical protein